MKGTKFGWDWPREWTWCAPLTWDRCPIGSGGSAGGFWFRRRAFDYAMNPEPSLTGEMVRRGFQENA